MEAKMFDWLQEAVAINWRYAIVLFFFYGGFRVFVDWIRDLKFYYTNSWDFSKSSGVKLNQAIGDDTPVPNRARVLFVAPLLFLIFTTSSCFIAFV
jgi:hypothetical protein